MYRSHDCGSLRFENINQNVTLSGWVHKIRNKGFIIWVDLRDRYGITQLIFDEIEKSIKIKTVLNNTEGVSLISKCQKIVKYKKQA